MLMFKRIYKAAPCPNHRETLENPIPENKRQRNEHNDLLAAYFQPLTGDDERIEIEVSQGWCAWGF